MTTYDEGRLRLVLMARGMCGAPDETTFICILQAGHDCGLHEAERDLMSDAERLIEKLGLAIHGEDPEVVVDVLASFVQGCCVAWGVPIEQFASMLVSQERKALAAATPMA